MEQPTGLLADVRVLDLTDGFGALAARILGDLGAEVWRIEPPGGGAGAQRAPRATTGSSLHHVVRNAGKNLLTLDPADEKDRAVVDGLLAGADVAFVADGWGTPSITPGSVAAVHEHLVTVAVTPFGLEGSPASWPATELVIQALAGVVYRSGVPELAPVAAPGSYGEDLGAVVGALGALLGLFQRATTGAGQLVDVAATLALAHCTDLALPLWSVLGTDSTRQGGGLYPLYACSDGLARLVLPMSPGEWRALIAWLGSPPEWSGPAWEKSLLDPAERDQVLARLPEVFAARTRAEVAAEGDACGVRITPVLTPAEVLATDHAAARGTFEAVEIDGRPAALATGFFSVNGHRAARGRAVARTAPPRWEPRPRPSGHTPGAAVLAGVRVLEIGSGIASPETGRVLGEWGADVIKVEHRKRPDFQRRVFNSDMNPAFATAARGKRGFGADLATPEGLELVQALLPQVDVVIENNATGVIDRLGLGWEALQAANPRIVLVSTQLYGNRGPWAARKGYGPSARASAGLAWLWAHGPDAPRGVQCIHPDHLAGRLGAIGALAALHARARTGQGTWVDIAQFEAVIGLLADLFAAESLTPGSAVPLGNRHPDHVPWNLYRCVDDGSVEAWLALSVTDDDAWQAVVHAADGAIPDDPAWRSGAGRRADADRVDAAVGAWLRGAHADTAESTLRAAGVAAGQVLHPRLVVDHPLYVERGYVERIDQPGIGPLLLEGAALTGTGFGRPTCRPAPLPGADTRAICRELLGLGDDAVDALVARGVLDVGD